MKSVTPVGSGVLRYILVSSSAAVLAPRSSTAAPSSADYGAAVSDLCDAGCGPRRDNEPVPRAISCGRCCARQQAVARGRE